LTAYSTAFWIPSGFIQATSEYWRKKPIKAFFLGTPIPVNSFFTTLISDSERIRLDIA